jgi:adenylate cyclase
MAIEIERKFLVSGPYKQAASEQLYIKQGYFSTNPTASVRVRTAGSKAFITIKGPGNATGVSRFEWDKEIPLEEADELLQFCENGIIEKIRYLIPAGKHVFEVDEFFGDNIGLVMAEIELEHEDEWFDKPSWLGEEVTGIKKYYNASLSQHPYKSWK